MGSSTTSLYNVATHTATAISASSAKALNRNSAARYRLFVNDGTQKAYLSFGTPAVAGQGIPLNANGGTYEMAPLYGNVYQGDVYVIGTSGNLLVTEGV